MSAQPGVTCSISGYIGLQFVDEKQVYLQTVVTHESTTPVVPITVSTGRGAHSELSWGTGCNFGEGGETPYAVLVTPPSDTAYLVVSATAADGGVIAHVCNGALGLSPMLPG
jgi:hypothetical protein